MVALADSDLCTYGLGWTNVFQSCPYISWKGGDEKFGFIPVNSRKVE